MSLGEKIRKALYNKVYCPKCASYNFNFYENTRHSLIIKCLECGFTKNTFAKPKGAKQ